MFGSITGIIGITFFRIVASFLEIPDKVMMVISAVTFSYALFALYLAQQHPPAIRPTKILIAANWLWSLISILLVYVYFSNASVYGKLYLILQVIVVGGLAYLEGKALHRMQHTPR